MFTSSVPPAPTCAFTLALFPAPPPYPTKNVIVSSVFAVIIVAIPAIGSPFGLLVAETDLGYAWFDWKLSLEHDSTSPPVSIPTKLPTLNPWDAIVKVNNPVCEI